MGKFYLMDQRQSGYKMKWFQFNQMNILGPDIKTKLIFFILILLDQMNIIDLIPECAISQIRQAMCHKLNQVNQINQVYISLLLNLPSFTTSISQLSILNPLMSIPANFLKQYIKFPTSKPPIVAQPCAQNITIPRIHSFCEKILKLKKQSHNIQCITDYDHTLTKFKHQGKRCDSLFGMWVANHALPLKFRQQLMNNYLYYGPYETDGTITFLEKYQLINQFYHVQTKLFESHKITLQQTTETIDKSNLVFRPFTRRLFEVLNQGKIPLYIISGGISDIIYTSIHELFGEVYSNISIHSNEFQMYQIHQKHGGHLLVDYKTTDFWNSILKPSSDSANNSSKANPSSGNINNSSKAQSTTQQTQIASQTKSPYLVKFRKPIIHSYNKFQIMKNHTSKRKNCILMGDLQSDIYMAQGVNYETILSIFYAKQGDTDQRAYAQEKFDLIVQGDGSHKVVVELIKIIKGKKNINWEYLSSVHPHLHEYLV